MTAKLKSQLAAAKVMDEVSPLAPISRQRRWQLEMERIGICRNCGGEYSEEGKKHCSRCLKKAREAYHAKRKFILDLASLVDVASK